VLYTSNDPIALNQAALIQSQLGRVGLDVQVRSFPFAVLAQRIGRRGEPFDMTLIGWFADYPDPYDFINVLLDGRRIQASNNVNFAYFDSAEYNRKMAEAARIGGPRRYRVYAQLDIDISRNAAPFAVLYNGNTREFVSARVGCYSFHPVWANMNLSAACLK
jgi:ABC-type transport system substrate-binding protein